MRRKYENHKYTRRVYNIVLKRTEEAANEDVTHALK